MEDDDSAIFGADVGSTTASLVSFILATFSVSATQTPSSVSSVTASFPSDGAGEETRNAASEVDSLPLPASPPPTPVVVAYTRRRSRPQSFRLSRLLRGNGIPRSQVAQTVAWGVGWVFFALASLAMYGFLVPAGVLFFRRYWHDQHDPAVAEDLHEAIVITVSNILGGIVSYLGLSTYFFYTYYIKQAAPGQVAAWKIQSKVPTMDVVWQEIRLSLVSVVVSTGLSGLQLTYLTRGGRSALYFNFGDRSWFYTVASSCGAFLLQDFFMYATHRTLHDVPFLMRTVHQVHHQFHQPTPYSVLAMHWIEAVLLESALVIPVFFFPIFAPYFFVSLAYVLYYGVIGHSGVDLQSLLPWQAPTWFHDRHHQYVTGNYGSSLMVWDIWFGTFRPRINTDEVIDVGSPAEDAPTVARPHHTDAGRWRPAAAFVDACANRLKQREPGPSTQPSWRRTLAAAYARLSWSRR